MQNRKKSKDRKRRRNLSSLSGEPPDIKNWFSSYVYESLGLSSSSVKDCEIELNAFSVPEEEEDKEHKPMNRNVRQMSDANLYESPLPSEPPDIGNWFSSYAYESPPILDTNDALYFSVPGEDSERVKETQTETDGNNVCPSLFDQELVSSTKVTDFSQSQNLLSEPPDVGNWFSSYVYESPHLSDSHELEFCSSEKDQLIVEESDTEEENSCGIFRKIKSNESLAADMAKEVSAYSNQEREKKKSSVSLFHDASTREVGKESSFKEEPLFCEMKDEARSVSHWGVNPKPQSLAYLEEPIRPKHKNNHDETMPRKSAQREEENQESETGFVTLKKKARVRDQSSMNRRVLGELKKTAREEEEEEEERKKKKRRVLGEMLPNHHQLSEIAGKWSCPQKKKGKSVPPLKQLRLDAWMHKVV